MRSLRGEGQIYHFTCTCAGASQLSQDVQGLAMRQTCRAWSADKERILTVWGYTLFGRYRELHLYDCR
jgi:hypothetical protein